MLTLSPAQEKVMEKAFGNVFACLMPFGFFWSDSLEELSAEDAAATTVLEEDAFIECVEVGEGWGSYQEYRLTESGISYCVSRGWMKEGGE